MKLSSPAFGPNEAIPPQYTCDGANAHPPLAFEGVPPEAKSLVLIMEDPDVPKGIVPGDVFDHWVVFNIPPKTEAAKEGEPLPGTYGTNSGGQAAYTGPCPPEGEHRYVFRLYALDAQLALKKGAAKKEVLEAIDGHIIAESELVARYERKNLKA
ncbi:YbhB/YbcL family Raf kinase inhibitor-like protein [Candidatus Parcubacteria bacterium]|nr:YbhB/YbcL family Raf kinase inhibitor-like protein [Candidatus Parcubacteria bacterium]